MSRVPGVNHHTKQQTLSLAAQTLSSDMMHRQSLMTAEACPHPFIQSQHPAEGHTRSRVAVSIEDAEILMATAEHGNIANAVQVPYKTSARRTTLKRAQDFDYDDDVYYSTCDQGTCSASDASPRRSNSTEGCCSQLTQVPLETASGSFLPSPPVKRVPKGLRSKRVPRQGSLVGVIKVEGPTASRALARGTSGPALAIKNGNVRKVVRSSSCQQQALIKSFQPGRPGGGEECSGLMLLLQACDVMTADPLLGAPPAEQAACATRHNNWAASPSGKSRAVSKTRRLNLMEEDCEAALSSGNGRRIRKPLDSDFVYYSNSDSMNGMGSADCMPERKGSWGSDEGLWNPGGRRRGARGELQGPCNHCFAQDSPQWRKGPGSKPVLCNACGTRFLRTRSLGKVRNGGKNREMEAAKLAEAALDEMMTDAEAVYDTSAAAAADAWGPKAPCDAGLPELDNVSSSTALDNTGLQKQNSALSVTTSLHVAAQRGAVRSAHAQQWQEMPVC